MADDPEKVKLDFKVCIVCQKDDKVALVEKPAFASFEKVLTCLEEWASYGHTSYWQAWEKLKLLSPSSLEKEQASWHTLWHVEKSSAKARETVSWPKRVEEKIQCE